MANAAPLPHEWMIISVIGFFVSWLFIYGDLGGEHGGAFIQWGATLMIFFIIMFLASVVSMSRASTEEDHLLELAIHERRRR